VGIADIPLVIAGMEEAEEFTSAFIDGKPSLDPGKVEKEMVGAAQRLAQSHPEVGALVLECTNMPPYAQAVQEVLEIPVFDVVTLVRYVHGSLERQAFGNFPHRGC
jgi:Asp/Glu/hydantoin racemase